MTGKSQGMASILLTVAALLWVVWGAVHLLAGITGIATLMSGRTAEAIHAITPVVELSTLQIDYPVSVSAILKQHYWNLAWAGAFTLIGAYFVWRQNVVAIFGCAVVGGLFDIGYFVAIDLAGLAAPPGPQMTYICATAILLSLFAYFRELRMAAT